MARGIPWIGAPAWIETEPIENRHAAFSEVATRKPFVLGHPAAAPPLAPKLPLELGVGDGLC